MRKANNLILLGHLYSIILTKNMQSFLIHQLKLLVLLFLFPLLRCSCKTYIMNIFCIYPLTLHHIKYLNIGIRTQMCFRGLILPLQNFFKTLESITELQKLHACTFDISEEFPDLNIRYINIFNQEYLKRNG